MFIPKVRFSLRALLLTTLAVSIPLAGLGVIARRVRDQCEAVLAIRTARGFVLYEFFS